MIQEHKENKEEDPLTLSMETVKNVLEDCGVPQPRLELFEEKYEEAFGADTELSPRNLVDNKLQVKTPDVIIQVNPERGDLIQTRVIDGSKYILIRAEGGVEVNGVDIHIREN